MNIYGVSIRGLIFNILLFIFVFYILKNQLFLEDSANIYQFYIFYLAMYFFSCVAKITVHFEKHFEKEKSDKTVLLIFCFFILLFSYVFFDNVLYEQVKFLYPEPDENDIFYSNTWNLNNPLFHFIQGIYVLTLLSTLFLLYIIHPIFFWIFSFYVFVCFVKFFEYVEKVKNKSFKKELENLSTFNPFILLFLAFILIIDSKNLDFHFKLISFFVFLLIGKYLLNTKNIELEKKVKEFFSKRATNKPFIKPEKSASKTITPIIKKENHVIEKGFSFNFSERLADIFTWENLKNNQILSSLLFLNIFIFLVDVERFFGIYPYEIWLFYSLIILPAYFIGKNIRIIKSIISSEEVVILLFKGSAWIFLSILLVIIGLFLFHESKLSFIQVLPLWFQNVFLVWQIYYFIALIILQTILILLSYFYFKIKKDKIL